MTQTPIINSQLDTANVELNRIAAATELIAMNSGSGAGEVKEWKSIRNFVRAGLVSKILQPGDQVVVDKESALSVTVSGTGITAATVNSEVFIAAVGHTGTAAYEFDYTGSTWHYDGNAVELSVYGIQTTGTPVNGDIIVVHETASRIVFDVIGIDYDVPNNAELSNSLTLMTHDVLLYNSIPFCQPQALFSVSAEEFPDGMEPGTYTITLSYGAYNGSTSEDGTYCFTTTQTIPVGGKIRHSSMGSWSSTTYNQARVLAGKFTTYDQNYNIIEQNLDTSMGSTGTSLGTTTASDPSKLVGSHINFTQRQIYGSNRYAHSANRKWLNSNLPGAASGQIATWWFASNEFDMPVKSTLPGFLYGLDPSFVACLGKVNKRTALCVSDGYGYEDTEEYIFLPSMTEVGFGNNNGIVETSVLSLVSGTPKKTTAYEYYIGAANGDRIKTQSGTARLWWLRSAYPSVGNGERLVKTSGALSYSDAHGAYAVVAACTIA